MNPSISLLFIMLAAFLFWLSLRKRQGLGIPEGQLAYQDMGADGKLRQPLYDEQLDLVGRPDYLIRQNGELIPVEVKSGRSPKKPYDSHIYQAAAYCLLVTANYQQRPSHALIRYPERTFKINFTQQLEDEIRNLITEMRTYAEDILPQRSHEHAARCRSCGYLQICDQSL